MFENQAFFGRVPSGPRGQRTPHASSRPLVPTAWAHWLVGIALASALFGGCVREPNWPKSPLLIGPPDAPSGALWRPVMPGASAGYFQQYRDGVKRGLYVDALGTGQFELLADLDELDPLTSRHVLVLLDGIPFDLFDELYRQGHFRLFHPPGRLVAPLPSSTEVAYPMIYGIPGTSALEAEFYVPGVNRVCGGVGLYISGDNELWATGLDYRQRLWMDGVGYMAPVWSTRREHAAMLDKALKVIREQPDKRIVSIYGVCTDCLCHMVPPDKAREVLIELDRRLERLVFETHGQVGLTVLADHGNNMAPDCRRAEIPAALERAGLKAVHNRGFKKPGEVVVPRFGLVSFARAYCQNEDDRAATVEAMLAAEGVEHVLWRRGDVVYVRGHGGRAEIARLTRGQGEEAREYFSYACTEGDPLAYADVLARLAEQGDCVLDGGRTYYESRALLAATAEHDYPDALWRSWRAFDDAALAIPDVLASLAPGWYYGSPGIDMWTGLNGTHGGLRRADTNTFLTSTLFVPPAVLRATDVPRLLGERIGWQPQTVPVEQNPMLKYFDPAAGARQRNLD